MLIDLVKELVLELLRILVIEDLCQRVKERIASLAFRGNARGREQLFHRLHVRHRDRLLHRITTGLNRKL